MLKLRRVGMLLLSFFMAVAMTGCGGDSDIASDKKIISLIIRLKQ